MMYRPQYKPKIPTKRNLLFVKQWPPSKEYSNVYTQYQLVGRLQRQAKKNTSNTSTEAESLFSGICKFTDPKVSVTEKYFWFCVTLVMTGVCAYQVMQGILLYASDPVKINIEIVRLHFVRFPAITVCPHHKEQMSARKQMIHQAMVANRIHRKALLFRDVTFKELNLTVDDLTNAGAIEYNEVIVTTPCLTKMDTDSCEKPFETNHTFLYSLFGRCLTIISDKDIQFRGPSTSLRVVIQRKAAMVLLHEPISNIRHDAFFLAEPVEEGVMTVKALSTKKFNFMNTRTSPCISPEAASKCRDECINKKIVTNLDVPCSSKVFHLPKLQDCKSVKEAINASRGVEVAYINLTSEDCVCTRRCNDVVYTVKTDTRLFSGERTGVEIHLFFNEGVQEVVTEELTYSFAALISDVGGSLGFYIGFCILQFLETIVGFFKKWCLRKSIHKRP